MRPHHLPVVVLIALLACVGSVAGADCTENACTATAPFAFPIALSACLFQGICPEFVPLAGVPDGRLSFWTNLDDGRRGTPSLRERIPSQCCSGGRCGDGDAPASLVVGDQIAIWSRRSAQTLAILEDCVEHEGFVQWTVPIVPCGATHGTVPVIGYTDVVVDSVDARSGIVLLRPCVPTGGYP
jgi:hypothetical protein